MEMLRAKKQDSGAAMIEYAVLVAFLAVALIGVLSEVGLSSRDKLCSGAKYSADLDENGVVDHQDLPILFVSDMRADLNCSGKIERGYNTSGRNTDVDLFNDFAAPSGFYVKMP